MTAVSTDAPRAAAPATGTEAAGTGDASRPGGAVLPDALPEYAVPRLDAHDRIWLIPAPQARWLAAGLFGGPVLERLTAFLAWLGLGPWLTWDAPALWVLWVACLTLGIVGALWRPRGRHVGQWTAAWLDFRLRPRRATWRPVAGRWLDPW